MDIFGGPEGGTPPPGSGLTVIRAKNGRLLGQKRLSIVLIKMVEDGGNGSIVKDKATFEKLKLRLNQIQENFVDSSPMEIVRRTLVDFQFNVSFGGKILAKDDFTCTVKIITIERDLLCYINTEWIGKGRSKKLAKYDAFKNLLSDMKV